LRLLVEYAQTFIYLEELLSEGRHSIAILFVCASSRKKACRRRMDDHEFPFQPPRRRTPKNPEKGAVIFFPCLFYITRTRIFSRKADYSKKKCIERAVSLCCRAQFPITAARGDMSLPWPVAKPRGRSRRGAVLVGWGRRCCHCCSRRAVGGGGGAAATSCRQG